MPLIVQKFGGTSVANATKILAAAGRAVAAKQAGHQVVMVVSARGHKTDELIELARDVTKTPPPREMDMLLATGEQESVALVAMAVHQLGEKAVSLTGSQIGIVTDSTFTKSRIKKISTDRIRKELSAGNIVVAAGFQGVDDDFNITTLGRGGSDTTATALAAVLEADLCEIYTDVEGVFTTDPRQVAEARKVNSISYDEMLELASSGAGVMHSRSIEFAKKYRVPLCVKPSYSDGSGTFIVPESDDVGAVVSGVALMRSEARVSLCDIPDRPGVMSLILSKMATRKIPIDMVVQDIGTNERAEVSFTVPQDDLAETLTAAEEAVKELGTGTITHGTNVSKVSVVGVGMRTHSGVAAQMFEALAGADINVGMITTSDIKISVLVDRDKCEAALKTVHATFGLELETAAVPHIGEQRKASKSQRMNRAQLERDVVARLSNMEDIVVSEVNLDSEQSRITVKQLPDVPGVSASIFTAVANGGVMVDMIVQNIGHDGHAHLSFTVLRQDVDKCLKLIEPVIAQWSGAFLTSDSAVALLSVRGIGLRTHTGVGEKMFRALAEAEVNIQMINTSEIRISTVVSAELGERALAALNAAFGL
ncbi:MAG: aspartate kinase [Planctomycetota bacterium]|nr:aspartate kinase [Planctomycetota bacterium]MDA1210903.1 aspartate kinase [Planctomycetota bacterium]